MVIFASGQVARLWQVEWYIPKKDSLEGLKDDNLMSFAKNLIVRFIITSQDLSQNNTD